MALKPPSTRFIILGQQRTGSNLVAEMLCSHPDIIAFNEVFSSRRTIVHGEDSQELTRISCDTSEGLLAARNEDPVGFLSQHVYGQTQKEVSAVGFKLFYEHYGDKNFPVLQGWMERETSILVIHLKRANVLRTLLSKRLAGRSGIWKIQREGTAQESGLALADHPIDLAPADCAEFFERTLMAERDAEFLLRRHRTWNGYYEDLERDPEGFHQAVCAFLGVCPHPPSFQLVKQTQGSLRQLIGNYAELKKAFEKSHARVFFED